MILANHLQNADLSWSWTPRNFSRIVWSRAISTCKQLPFFSTLFLNYFSFVWLYEVRIRYQAEYLRLNERLYFSWMAIWTCFICGISYMQTKIPITWKICYCTVFLFIYARIRLPQSRLLFTSKLSHIYSLGSAGTR